MKGFTLANDGVDPGRVPARTTYTGAKIPAIGFGTFGSDHASPDLIADCVKEALSVGYRHIDCASVYGNENEIGDALSEVFQSGSISRDEVWITSKLWNDKHGDGDVLLSVAQTLKDLQLDYLDLYLVHWPFPNHHPPGCDTNFHSPDAKPFSHERFMKTWRQMERLVDMGLVKHIGTSNVTIPKLKPILDDARIKPACSEMELHPHFQQPELFQFVIENGIVPIGYSPIGSPNRPERDTTPEDTVDMEDPVIQAISKRLGIHPAVTCLKWAVQNGQIPIPFSTKRRNILSNLQGVVSEPISDSEMEELAGVDKNCRLIKGQVFLWEGSTGWEDLWDLNGTITAG